MQLVERLVLVRLQQQAEPLQVLPRYVEVVSPAQAASLRVLPLLARSERHLGQAR